MKYSDSHEWIKLGDVNKGTVGISTHAQKELGEIVYIEFPEIGREIKAGEEVVILESTKAAADIYSPVSGKIIRINEALKENVDLINLYPEGEGWIFEIALSKEEELTSLMTKESYMAEH